jgi:hypothetical protein
MNFVGPLEFSRAIPPKAHKGRQKCELRLQIEAAAESGNASFLTSHDAIRCHGAARKAGLKVQTRKEGDKTRVWVLA